MDETVKCHELYYKKPYTSII